MEIEPLFLANTVWTVLKTITMLLFHDQDIFYAAVHLVRGREDQRRPASTEPRGLKNVKGSGGVNVKIAARISYRRRNSNLSCQMVDEVSIGDSALDRTKIPNVSLNNSQPR